MIKLTSEQKQAIYDLREEGLSCVKIANKLGFSESLVDYYLRKLTKAERSLQIVDNETLYSEIDFLKDQLNRQKKLNEEWKKKYRALKKEDKNSFREEVNQAKSAVAKFEKQVNILWLCINRAIDEIDHNTFDIGKFYEQARDCMEESWIK